MKIDYRGHEIEVKQEKCLMGTIMTYYSVFRNLDRLEVINGYTDGLDAPQVLVDAMKVRIDELLETNGASEFLEKYYE